MNIAIKIFTMLLLIHPLVTQESKFNYTLTDNQIERLFPQLECLNDFLAESSLKEIGNTSCFETYIVDTYTITGENCSEIPRDHLISANKVRIKKTGIKELKEDSFSSWPNIKTLIIDGNENLMSIKPGAFKGLTSLTNLSISGSPMIKSFHRDTFKELKELLQLLLLRNGITRLRDVTPSLATNTLTKLNYLDVSDNCIAELRSDDFQEMYDASLYTFKMTLSKTVNIHPDALKPVFNLKLLILSENSLNSSVLASMLEGLPSNMSLAALGLSLNLLGGNVRPLLETISKSNISGLDLSNNHISQLSPGFFPIMPKIKDLDMSGNMITDFSEGIINETIMPKLEILKFNENKLIVLKPSIAISTLTQLFMTKNSANYAYQPTFQIPPNIFKRMPSLKVLDLSRNNLYAITNETFNTAESLNILYLRKTSLYHIQDFSFIKNNNLTLLDLSENDFPAITHLTRNIFKGLDSLKGLDLSSCRISSFMDKNVFKYLPKLNYLSLRGNSIIELPSEVFEPLKNLTQVDLRSNFIVSWTSALFPKIDSLHRIMLTNNQITVINKQMIEDFKKAKIVDLANNPIVCDCLLINTLEDGKALTSPFLFQEENKCFTPFRKSLREFINARSEMNCTKIEIWLIVLIAFLTALLVFVACLIFFYFCKLELIYWVFKLRQKLGLNLRKKGKDSGKKYKYDAFISYSHEDKRFVEKMVAILEGKFKLSICWDMNFQIGDLITESVMESVASSKTVIMVLTNAFAKSQWCLWELQIAHQKSLFFRNAEPDSIIIIKLSHIEEPLMTACLKHLLKTRLYLKWYPSLMKQKIFWHQLQEAINR